MILSHQHRAQDLVDAAVDDHVGFPVPDNDLHDTGHVGTCRRHQEATGVHAQFGLLEDGHATLPLSQAYGALGDVIASGPDVTELDLPGGESVRIDVGLSLPGYEATSSSYVYTDGMSFHTLTCTDSDWPEDRWLSIAETFELPEAL